jgi:hypothetical protein
MDAGRKRYDNALFLISFNCCVLLLSLIGFPIFILFIWSLCRGVCSYYEVLFADVSDPQLREQVSRHPDHSPSVFIEFQDKFLFLDYNYPPLDDPNAVKESKAKEGKAKKQIVDTPEVVISEEDVEDFPPSLKRRVRKPSGTGGPYKILARARDARKPGVAPVATMEADMKEMSAKQIKVPSPRLPGRLIGACCLPNLRKKLPVCPSP